MTECRFTVGAGRELDDNGEKLSVTGQSEFRYISLRVRANEDT